MPQELVQLIELLKRQQQTLVNFKNDHPDSTEVSSEVQRVTNSINISTSVILAKRGVFSDNARKNKARSN